VTDASQRARIATIIAIVTPESQAEAAAALSALCRHGAVLPVIISLGNTPDPPRGERDGAVVIDGLVPRYLDNAVASLRLSSLPAMVWWRAGDPAVLQTLAVLVDRVVLDLDDPAPGWALVPSLAPLAPVSDIRWARLTRWRDLLAQFFDVPEVRAVRYDRLSIAGSDVHDARLLGGWLKSRLPDGGGLEVTYRAGAARLEAVELAGDGVRLAVRLVRGGGCLETTVDLGDGRSSSRVVARGDDGLAALLGQELRVRARDLAFEDAVREGERS
jgi:glucose-6-phosphate dehydrogenase assembly protein OpcA